MSGNTQGGQTAAQPAQPALTRESLERDHAALFAQVRTEFTTAGAAAERDRVAGVRAQSVPGHEALIEKMAADGKSTGADAAMAIVAATKQQLAAAKAAHEADAPRAAHSDAGAAAAAGSETELSKDEQVAKAKAYAAEHKVSFIDAMKALGFAS